MRRAIVLCGLLAACHASGSARPEAARVDTWEVANGSPCEARVRVADFRGRLVQNLGTVGAGATRSFQVPSILTRDYVVSAMPLEPDGKSLCGNHQNLVRMVVVRKLPSST